MGAFPAGAAEPSIKSDVAAARKLFAEWPTPIVAVGAEVGEALPYPGASIEKDFAWSPAHPVVDAYRAFKPMPYDAPAAALAAMLHAVQPDEGFFKLSDPGTISVQDDGRTQFTPGAGGTPQVPDRGSGAEGTRHRRLHIDGVGASPAPRPGRRRTRSNGVRPYTFVLGVAAAALLFAVQIRSSAQAPPAARAPRQTAAAGAPASRPAPTGTRAGLDAAADRGGICRGHRRCCSTAPAASVTTRARPKAASTSRTTSRSNRSPIATSGS